MRGLSSRKSEPLNPSPSIMTEPSSPHVTDNEPQIGDSLELLLGQKPLLLTSAVLLGIVGMAYTSFVPARYEVKSTILLPGTKAQSSLASAAQSLGVSTGSADTTLPMFRKILESESVTSAVSKKCGLPNRTLRQIRTIEDDGKTNSIDITVQHRDKAFAIKVASEYIVALRAENSKLSLPSKGRRIDNLLAALNNKNQALSEAEEKMERFVSTAKTSPGVAAPLEVSSGSGSTAGTGAGGSGSTTIPAFRYQDQVTTLSIELEKLDNQLKLIDSKSEQASKIQPDDFPPVAAWKEQRSELQARLNTARALYNSESPEYRDVQTEYNEVEKLQQKDVDKYLDAVKRRVTGDVSKLDQDRAAVIRKIESIRRLANAAPREALEYQRLLRNVSTLSQIAANFRLEYERAKLDSADDPNRWEVLDAPTAAEEPVNKKYSRNVSLGALAGFFLAMPFALKRARRRSRV